MDIVDRIDLLAKKKGWSRSEVLRRVGLSPAAASDWRKGKASPEKHVENLAATLGTSAAYLRGEIEEPVTDKPSIGDDGEFDNVRFALHTDADDLTDEDIQDVIDFVRFTREKRNKRQ